jgi:hypothetical protein
MGNLAYMGFWRAALDQVEGIVKAQNACAVRVVTVIAEGSDWRAVGALLQQSRRDI